MTSSANTPALQLDGEDLTSIEIDFQARLKFDGITVAIGTPFRLTVETETQMLDPETRAMLGPLLAVYPAKVRSAKVLPDLTLRLEFTSGVVIEVPEDPAFEAWSISCPGSRFIVCPPAGGYGLAYGSDERTVGAATARCHTVSKLAGMLGLRARRL